MCSSLAQVSSKAKGEKKRTTAGTWMIAITLLVMVTLFALPVEAQRPSDHHQHPPQENTEEVPNENVKLVENFFGKREKGHTNNWAVLVSTSRFWFNYRHAANTLSIYRSCRRLGIPDSHIILMLADDMPCNPRNSFPGVIFNNENHKLNLYGTNVEVDYRGYEVTVQNFIRLITGRQDEKVPQSKRLLSDDRSNVLVYMTGHGGNGFLKFQDYDEISSSDLSDGFEQMYQQRRYHELLYIVDTCQANTMYGSFYSPNIIGMGSSSLDESSYAHHHDRQVGVSIIDRYTFYMLEFFEKDVQNTNKTVRDLHSYFDVNKLEARPGIRTDLFPDRVEDVQLTDFFGCVVQTELTPRSYPLLRNQLIQRPRS